MCQIKGLSKTKIMDRQIRLFAEDICDLYCKAYPDKSTAQTDILLDLVSHALCFGTLCKVADRPAGFILCMALGEVADIIEICVDPHFQNIGIGKALIADAADQARQKHIQALMLEVAIDNDHARYLYHQTAFVEIARRPDYYARKSEMVDAIVMKKNLV